MAFDFPSSPTLGQTYQVTGGPTYVWNGTAWQVLTPGSRFNRQVYTATAGQTTFNATYLIGGVDVFHNGVKLAPADFTASNGSTVVLVSAANAGDTIEIVSYSQVNYTNAVQKTGDTMTGNLNFSGNGLRITGDFTNATLANRLAFQTTTVNGATAPLIIPNGTGSTAGIIGFNSSDPDNASFFSLLAIGSTDIRLSSGATGTGTNRPMTFYTAGSERARIDNIGNVGIGQTSPTKKLCVANSGAAEISLDPFGRSGETATSILSYNRSTNAYIPIHIDGSVQQFYTSGTEKMRIDASGNVGIGASAPTYPLHLVKDQASNSTWMASQNQTATGAFGAGFLAAAGSSNYYTVLGQAADGNFSITNANGTNLIFGTSGVERARFTTSGDLCIGISSSGGYKIRSDGATGAYITSSGSNTAVSGIASGSGVGTYGQSVSNYGVYGQSSSTYGIYGLSNSTSYGGVLGMSQNNINYGILGFQNAWAVYGAGSAYISGTYQGSDARLKNNIQSLGNSLDVLVRLRAVTFDWKPNTDASVSGMNSDVGLIAQEAISVLPNIVREVTAPPIMEGQNATLNQELGKFYTIDYGKLIPYLVDAVQELKLKLDAAEARIAQLEGTN